MRSLKRFGKKMVLYVFFIVMLNQCQSQVVNPENNEFIQKTSVRTLKDTGNLLIENLLQRDYMLYRDRGLHYSEACAAVGALRFSTLTGNQLLITQLIQRYHDLLDESSSLVNRRPHVDLNVVGIVPLQVYLINKEIEYLEQGLTFADTQWDSTIDGELTFQTRWWIDDMYMVGMLQIQAYRATGELEYADRAARQLVAYLEKLQQENGLFYHGPEFKYFWGRGNGWVASSLAEVLSSLPENHKHYSQIMAGYQKMMLSLKDYQSDNGMWRQLIDYEYSWVESSCTAMFTYALAKGVNKKWIPEKPYKSIVEKAWPALAAHIDRKGNLREICVGTGQKDDIEFYLNRPRHSGDLHGQAPVLWLIDELLCETSVFSIE